MIFILPLRFDSTWFWNQWILNACELMLDKVMNHDECIDKFLLSYLLVRMPWDARINYMREIEILTCIVDIINICNFLL